jgi:hypothetical protein
MPQKPPTKRTMETEQKAPGIAGKHLYHILHLILESLAVLIPLIQLIAAPIQSGLGIALIVIVVMVLFVLSLVVGEEARRVDWSSRINDLMILKTMAEHTPQLSVPRGLYPDRLIELYLIAVSEGRKDLARELWKKGQLVK